MRTLRWFIAALTFALAAPVGANRATPDVERSIPSRDDRAEALPPRLLMSDGFGDEPGRWRYEAHLKLAPGVPAPKSVDIRTVEFTESSSGWLVVEWFDRDKAGILAQGHWLPASLPLPRVREAGTLRVRMQFDITWPDGQRSSLANETEFTEAERTREAAAHAWPRRVPHSADAPYGATLDGAVVYERLCVACHDHGIANTPKQTRAAWEPRLAQGRDTLVRHAIDGYEGKGIMPPRGGHPDLSDEQIAAAVDWMLANLK